MNTWTPLEEEIYRRGMTSSFLQLAKRFKITTDEVREVYERAHIKFQTFDEEFKWNFNNGGRNVGAWSEEEMDLIDEAVKDGMTAAQAEDLFPGRTWKAIAVKMGRRRKALGLPATTKKWTKEDEREVIDGVLRGDSHASIALRIGHGKGSVSAKVRELKATGLLPDVDGRRRN